MPVRWTIHSSEVSTYFSSSRLVTQRRGNAEPTPFTTERRRFFVFCVNWGVPILVSIGLSRSAGCVRAIRPRDAFQRGGVFVGERHHVADLFKQAMADHVGAELDGAGKAVGVHAAMRP